MESWLTIFCVTTLCTAGSAQSVIYGIIGAEVVLKPPVPPESGIKSVLWKHNGSFAVEWEAENITEYPLFKGRSDLSRSNGELTLKSLTVELSGKYDVEINYVHFPPSTNLFVIARVTKPTISVSCNEDNTKCTLTCEGNVEALNPRPTYIWKFNNTEQTHLHDKLEITRETTATEFTCELKNPVSESSDPLDNPFTSSPAGGLKINTGVVVGACLLAVVLGVVLVHRVKSGMWFFQKDSMPWEADFWQTGVQGAAVPADEQPGERNAVI